MVIPDADCAGPSGPMAFRYDVRPDDPATVQQLAAATGFFSTEEIGIAVELVEERLCQGVASGYEFLFVEHQGQVVGYTCFGPIPGTQGSYDLYWIIVDPQRQGEGIGKRLLERSEAIIRRQGGRRLYIETSSRGQYQPTQAFYQRCGYHLEALLEDFYAPGDGKLIYGKRLELRLPLAEGRL